MAPGPALGLSVWQHLPGERRGADLEHPLHRADDLDPGPVLKGARRDADAPGNATRATIMLPLSFELLSGQSVN